MDLSLQLSCARRGADRPRRRLNRPAQAIALHECEILARCDPLNYRRETDAPIRRDMNPQGNHLNVFLLLKQVPSAARSSPQSPSSQREDTKIAQGEAKRNPGLASAKNIRTPWGCDEGHCFVQMRVHAIALHESHISR